MVLIAGVLVAMSLMVKGREVILPFPWYNTLIVVVFVLGVVDVITVVGCKATSVGSVESKLKSVFKGSAGKSVKKKYICELFEFIISWQWADCLKYTFVCRWT